MSLLRGFVLSPTQARAGSPQEGRGPSVPRQKEAQLEVARRGRASLADGPLRLTGRVATPPGGKPSPSISDVSGLLRSGS